MKTGTVKTVKITSVIIELGVDFQANDLENDGMGRRVVKKDTLENMEFIVKSLKRLKEKANLPTLYRLQGYCLGKGYHFYMYNHCANNDYRIDHIRITDKKDKTIATASVNIPTWTKIDTETQYC